MTMRVQVNMEESMVDKVDYYAKAMGVSRSAFCSFIVGQYILSFESGLNAVQKSIPDTLETLTKDLVKPLV